MKRRAITRKYPHASKGHRFFKKPSDAAKHLWGTLPKWKLGRATEALMAGGFVKLAYVIFDHADPSKDQVTVRLTVKKGSPEAAAIYAVGTKATGSQKLTHEYVRRKYRLALSAAGSP
jgi:hypothetical protein